MLAQELQCGRRGCVMADRGALGRRLGWIALAIVPPSILSAAFLEWIQSHPLRAITVAASYELVIAGATFAGDVAGELRRRWRDRVVDRLDHTLRRRLSRYSRRYREFLLSSLRFIDLKGLATIGYYTPELDAVFVDVTLALRAPHQVSGDVLADVPAEVSERRSIQDFLDQPRPVVLAVIGAPGSGKTTLLRYTARQACKPGGWRGKVPLLLSLRDHVTTVVAEPHSTLPEVVRGTLGRYAAEEPPGWFDQQLKDGRCLVLLDGLDEVARQGDRRCMVDWVDRQIKQYPGNDYVITSRPHGYHTTPLDGATVLQVRRFTDEQVRRFVHGWYLAVERHSTGTDDEGVQDRAEFEAEDLLKRLRDTPALHDLTVNPLLLTMVANVHRYRGGLPGSRADLYAEICQVLLWRRLEAKKLQAELRGEQKEVLLRELAFTMMRRRVRDLTRTEVLRIIGLSLPKVSTAVTAEGFLSDVATSGLLIERENDVYAFAHQTFQEYLAAAHIREKGRKSVLAAAVGDPWWREATLLYVARADAGPIVEACLAAGSVAALALAFDCANQASELAPLLRTRLDALLTDAGNPTIRPERRRLMAAVTVTRQLRDRVRVADSGGHVSLRPIPKGVYQLFLDGLQARGETRTPDGADPASSSTADEPAVGVRGSDAVAFLAWLNDLVGSEVIYRLPTRAEIDHLAAHRPRDEFQLSVWLAPNGDEPELWTPPGSSHPHAIDRAILRQHLTTDLEDSSLLVALLLTRSRILLLNLAHAIDLMRDRALALDRAFALHAPRVRDRSRALDEVLDRARARALGLARELALEKLLEPDLHYVRALALDLAPALPQERDHVPDRAHAIAPALEPGRARELARTIDFDRTLDLAETLNVILDRDLSRASESARTVNPDGTLAVGGGLVLQGELTRGIDLVRALGLDLDLNLGLALGQDLNVVFGNALAQLLSDILGPQVPFHEHSATAAFQARVAGKLLDLSAIPATAHVVSLDRLADQVRSARSKLIQRLPVEQPPQGLAVPWALEVANRLERTAVPIFTRQQRLDPATAAAIRLPALCLAAEAHELCGSKADPTDTFHDIARGITLLERRHNGQLPPTETIHPALG